LDPRPAAGVVLGGSFPDAACSCFGFLSVRLAAVLSFVFGVDFVETRDLVGSWLPARVGFSRRRRPFPLAALVVIWVVARHCRRVPLPDEAESW
jgi:hypothetical protein